MQSAGPSRHRSCPGAGRSCVSTTAPTARCGPPRPDRPAMAARGIAPTRHPTTPPPTWPSRPGLHRMWLDSGYRVHVPAERHRRRRPGCSSGPPATASSTGVIGCRETQLFRRGPLTALRVLLPHITSRATEAIDEVVEIGRRCSPPAQRYAVERRRSIPTCTSARTPPSSSAAESGYDHDTTSDTRLFAERGGEPGPARQGAGRTRRALAALRAPGEPSWPSAVRRPAGRAGMSSARRSR